MLNLPAIEQQDTSNIYSFWILLYHEMTYMASFPCSFLPSFLVSVLIFAFTHFIHKIYIFALSINSLATQVGDWSLILYTHMLGDDPTARCSRVVCSATCCLQILLIGVASMGGSSYTYERIQQLPFIAVLDSMSTFETKSVTHAMPTCW